MNWLAGAAWAAGLWLCLAGAGPADAAVTIVINKSTQRMAVMVDGAERYVWKISTGLGGGPPNGSYRPERMETSWFSRKYGMSPMPHSIFFHEGYAIHGTIYVSGLGQRASHGCVRLHPDNATTLFDLVKSQGVANTTIVVLNTD
jgi:lipoprotein-anchoring transpeptidase ErfK/SrfK